MPDTKKPRKGSMGYWPRKRAKKIYPRIRGWSKQAFDTCSLLGFAGYKAGMTHIIGVDNKKTSPSKGEEIRLPVTVIECPPIKIFCARFYKKNAYGLFAAKDFFFKPSKDLQRKLSLPKKFPDIKELDKLNPDDYADISVLAYTQPVLAGIGKRRPEVFELKLSGTNKDKLEFVKTRADKEISVDEVFKEAQTIDAHAITKGKGIQGPVRRFGIGLKHHKSEKGRRQPGSRGPWKAQQHIMYRTAYSGQTGFHQRMQHSLQIIKIGDKPEEVNPKDGFPHYGRIKTKHLLVKGSVPGTKKRLVLLTQPLRPAKKEEPVPTITHISLQSKQGR
ncbi:50S ribosomal protein L3 [Candidatus Woesearchaeota archaeon]|nr:50S ribosomal protein L3 [Candidatus Woesearchaeota archaeon]